MIHQKEKLMLIFSILLKKHMYLPGMSISKKNLLYSEKYRSRSVDCVLIAIKEIMKEKFYDSKKNQLP